MTSRPVFSVVTISFNQAEFLERTIRSVIDQEGVEIDYIMVDPGSSDGSRDIIERYRDHFSHVLLEPDNGPADGLNKGFAKAKGDIYCYLNSDDTFLPGAFTKIVKAFEDNPEADVICAHCWAIDKDENRLRRVWSNPFHRKLVSYGMSIQIQPSTFIRREAYIASGGFEIDNRSNWDGELILDLALTGHKIQILNAFLSNYRLHPTTLTVTGNHDAGQERWFHRRFERLMGRPWRRSDKILQRLWWLRRQLRHPAGTLERIFRGPVYRRKL